MIQLLYYLILLKYSIYKLENNTNIFSELSTTSKFS